MERTSCVDFFDKLAANWDLIQNPIYAARIPYLMDKAAISAGERILDVGCGTGILYPHLEQRGGQTVSIDISSNMLAELKKKYPQAQTICGCFISEELPANHFDKVIIFNAFPHFDDKKTATHKAFSILKKGGHILIIHSLTRKELARVHGKSEDTQRDVIPTQIQLKEILLSVGFCDIELTENEYGCYFSGRKY